MIKIASLGIDGYVECKISTYRCHFRAFQLELDNPDTKNFQIGSVVKKLQPFEVGQNRPKIQLIFLEFPQSGKDMTDFSELWVEI